LAKSERQEKTLEEILICLSNPVLFTSSATYRIKGANASGNLQKCAESGKNMQEERNLKNAEHQSSLPTRNPTPSDRLGLAFKA
jgi:hypothetical protein